jgi:hypothetical protein
LIKDFKMENLLQKISGSVFLNSLNFFKAHFFEAKKIRGVKSIFYPDSMGYIKNGITTSPQIFQQSNHQFLPQFRQKPPQNQAMKHPCQYLASQ